MADQGFGTSITFQSSLFSAQITGVTISGVTREALDTTVMDTTSGAMTFIPSDLTDAGELQVQLKFHPHTKIAALKTALSAAAETITITFPVPTGGSSGATWSSSGFMTAFNITSEMGSIITADATIKFSGVATCTAGS